MMLGRVNHKISLYVDDVALFVSDQSIRHLLHLIKKSELISIANDLDHLFLSSTDFKITSDNVKYLGIKTKCLKTEFHRKIEKTQGEHRKMENTA